MGLRMFVTSQSAAFPDLVVIACNGSKERRNDDTYSSSQYCQLHGL